MGAPLGLGVKGAANPVVTRMCGTWKPRRGPGGWSSGRPTVRGAEFLGGNRMPNKRMPVVERRQETCGEVVDPSVDRCGITGRIPALWLGPKGR